MIPSRDTAGRRSNSPRPGAVIQKARESEGMAEVVSRQLLRNAALSISTLALAGWTLAWMLSAKVGLEARYLYSTATLLGAGSLLLLWRLQSHHPFDRFGPANLVTVARGVLTMLLAGLIGMGQGAALESLVFGVAAPAAILDGVDGRLARRSGMSSAYGARFDMECDAFLILVLSILVLQFDKAGAWVLTAGLMRYAFVAAGWIWPRMGAALPASRRRKWVAALQSTALVIAVAPWVPASAAQSICAVALLALVGSFIIDTVWLWRR